MLVLLKNMVEEDLSCKSKAPLNIEYDANADSTPV